MNRKRLREVWLLGALLLPVLARAGAYEYTLPWENPAQELKYRNCGCADACWIAELRSKKSGNLLVKLRCTCEKLMVTSAADVKKEEEYRPDCKGFDTEEKFARIAAEVKALQESRSPKKKPAKK
jgi:hypothetical protein